MSKLKVATILGTRPEIIRLSEVIKSCDQFFNHLLIHTGQNYDPNLKDVFFTDFNLRQPDHYLDCVGENLGETMGNIIAKSYQVLAQEKPDAVLILGDTNSALAAISAKRLKIPIFHMEAGNRCWDWNVPEMINRRIVDVIADINLPYTEHSRRYLLSEGVDGKTIFVTGSPMYEVLTKNQSKVNESKILDELGLEAKKYFVLSAHREENIDQPQNFSSLITGINAVAEKYQLPIIYSAHPRSQKQISTMGFKLHPLVRQLDPLGFFAYNKLQQNALCTLSDSGTISEESAMLHFPAISIRTSTERPEAIDLGSIVLGGISEHGIIEAVELAINSPQQFTLPADYAQVNVAEKVVKIIQSYTGIVNQTTWRK